MEGQSLAVSRRIQYLDWLRGLAAVIMLQGHVADGWVRAGERTREWYGLTQFFGGLPAPIFLFVVGVSMALMLDRMRRKGTDVSGLMLRVAKRSCWILAAAYLFRIQQWWTWYPASPWSDIFRVDTLNCIAVSMLLIGVASACMRDRRRNMIGFGLATITVVAITPFVYPIRAGLPDGLLAYLNGGGQTHYFSIFPWTAFSLAGITFGYALLEARARDVEARFFTRILVGGICAFAAGSAMILIPAFEYGYFDYSLTSPHFFLVRLGWVLLILAAAYRWSLRRTSDRWSPSRTFGKSSLLVYWVHVELVYGPYFHEAYYRNLSMPEMTMHLGWFIPAMLGLVIVRQQAWTWVRWGLVQFRSYRAKRVLHGEPTAEAAATAISD